MSQAIIARRIAPRILRSGLVQALTSANTDYPVTVPDGAIALRIAFYDTAGALVRGRIGFSPAPAGAVTLADGDDTLGYQGPEAMTYLLSPWCQVVHLASPTAGVTARGMWLYD